MKILEICKRIIDLNNQRKIWKYEKRKYLLYCNDSNNYWKSNYKYERDILILTHTIEKGMSHKKMKPKFGIDAVNQLLNSLIEYAKQQPDQQILDNGFSILKKYIEINIKLGVNIEELPCIPEDINFTNNVNVGAYQTSGKDAFLLNNSDFNSMAISRRAIRLYDQKSKPVALDQIIEALNVARYSPSACNRQAVRIFYTNNLEKISSICRIQKGSRGFGENAGGLIIICSDLKYYTMAERRLPMFDCGLFAMSLVYSLFQQNIGTCILNGSFNEEQETQIAELMGIDNSYMISSLITVNKIENDDVIMIAKSDRMPAEHIITFVV